ncbi:MAG: YARHG domain-containing protein [Blastocatellia bacterium]|nr:YARHG domain-containing protein [Blastocatellia bacterium]
MKIRFLLGILLAASVLGTACSQSKSVSAPATTGPKQPGTSDAAAALDTAKSGSGRQMYYQREITAADVQGRSLRELNLLRNTIYARAGNPFRKAWLNEYFSAQSWYKPLAKMDESKLTALDRKNGAFIAEYEAKLPRTDLEARKGKLLDRPETELSKEDTIELMLLRRALGEAPAGTETATATPLDDPRMLEKLLNVNQLNDLSRRDLRLLRNTVYARRGREFKSAIMQEYFGRMAWYKGDAAYTDDKLTEIDRQNINIIRSLEDQLGGPLTDADQNKEDGWFGAA